MSARDEGAGTMGRGEEAVSLLRRLTQAALDMSTGIEVHNRMSPGAGARLEDIKGPVPSELHAAACAARNWLYDALDAPVSAPGMDREEGIRGPHEPVVLGLNGPSADASDTGKEP